MKKSLIAALALFSSSVFAEVTVENPYARAVAPGQMNSAAFMNLSNSADNTVDLIAARSNAAKSVELHTHTQVEGVMQMRQIDKVEIPAKGSVMLAPGGLHIMFIGLNQAFNEGENVDLSLEFSDGTTQALSVPIKMVMPHGMKHKMQ
jgi:hypothetical protein